MNLLAGVLFKDANKPKMDEELMYGDGSKPDLGGETSAFLEFMRTHLYAPQTRKDLEKWVIVMGIQ